MHLPLQRHSERQYLKNIGTKRMVKMLKKLQRLSIIWMTLLCVSFGLNDPCDKNNHEVFPQNSFGSRKEICEAKVYPICDFYLKESWYVVNNATLLNECPVTGDCGVAYPTWMRGSFPRISDGEVNQTACIKKDGDCCNMNVTMTIKNCTTFFVFYLQPLPACPMVYCFESSLPCDPPTTTGGAYYTTTHNQDAKDETHPTSKTLLIGICAGAGGLLLGAAVLCGWMWATGRLFSKGPSTMAAKKTTTVSPHIISSSYANVPPPPYSEK